MTRKLFDFSRDSAGVATVELALVLPILLSVFLGAYSIWDAASRRQNLNAALDVGEQYYINGGSNDDAASQAIQGAWQYRPNNSSISLTRACQCGTVAQACSTLCSGSIAPSAYVTMRLTAVDQTAMISPNMAASRVVRVR
jgi:Flp pilus assembly protein TadG